MDKCLIIKFKNAGIFVRNNNENVDSATSYNKFYIKTADKVLNCGQVFDRTKDKIPYGITPVGTLSQKQICNLLHVFMGERPKPSFRDSIIELDNDIVDLSKNCKVKITSLIDEGKYISELKQIRKSNYNAYSKTSSRIFLNGKYHNVQGLLYWERIKQYLEQDLYNEFVNILKNIINDEILKLPVTKVIELLNKDYLQNEILQKFLIKCKENKKTVFYNLVNCVLSGGKLNAAFNQDERTKLCVVKGIEYINKIDGIIYVPINDNFIARLNNGTGIATFLEGGFAWIDSIQYMSEDLIFDSVNIDMENKLCIFQN